MQPPVVRATPPVTHDSHPRGFEIFLVHHRNDFARIARASREWTADDVRNEAWTLAYDIGLKLGRALDLGDTDDATMLLSHLHNHCVRFTETVVRHAHRLDHAAAGDEDRGQHWLMDRLTADDGAHPLSMMEVMESEAAEPDDPDPYHSPAAGWLWLVQRFNQRMSAIADFLLISPSWCYACCRQAHHLARTQWPLPHGLHAGDHEAAIRPWRKFKLPSAPDIDVRQLAFDFPEMPSRPLQWQFCWP